MLKDLHIGDLVVLREGLLRSVNRITAIKDNEFIEVAGLLFNMTGDLKPKNIYIRELEETERSRFENQLVREYEVAYPWERDKPYSNSHKDIETIQKEYYINNFLEDLGNILQDLNIDERKLNRLYPAICNILDHQDE